MATSENSRLPPLRPTIAAPLWLQLKHALKDYITFQLKPGDRIPTEPQLCEHYTLSRITVRQAVTSLVDEGLLHKQQGRGTFVLAARLAQNLDGAEHFLTSGFDAEPPDRVKVFSAESVPAPDWLARKLGITAGEDVFKIRKVLAFPGSDPIAFRTTFLPASLAPSLLQLSLNGPIFDVLESFYGLNIETADEIIEFIVADEFRSSILKTETGHPLVLVERVSYLGSGQAVDCSRSYYRADKFRFEHRLQRKNHSVAAPGAYTTLFPGDDWPSGMQNPTSVDA